ncbi:MAG: gamma-glutamyltransferase, partial [Lachnospiraceae bacterium]|nr:gamma-glutamyltransferase [Lachnospiraceae bacterium]
MSVYEKYFERALPPHYLIRPEISGKNGAVSSNNPYATKAGLEILRKGGNAVDAAVAVSLALGVVEPCDSGIGGGCFSLFYDGAQKKYHAYDARGTAPAAASEDMFLGPDGKPDPELTEFSGRPVATPTMYRLYDRLLKEHGTMSLREVSEPAIRLARDGFYCGFFYASSTARPGVSYCAEHFEGFSELYLSNGGCRPFGERIRNPELADTMEQVAQNGAEWFYDGPIAEEIAAAAARYGGLITKE